MNRGDIILVRFPHPSGIRGKKRPAVVVQADVYNQTTVLEEFVGSPVVLHAASPVWGGTPGIRHRSATERLLEMARQSIISQNRGKAKFS